MASWRRLFPVFRGRMLSIVATATLMVVWYALPRPVTAEEERVEIPRIDRQVDFAKEVFPIFEARCFVCHGEGLQQSGFRLDSKAAVFQGGMKGIAVQPGSADSSPLFQRVSGLGDLNAMPPVGDRLSPDQLGLIQAWIEQGAKWPDGVGVGTAQVSKHWAYEKPVRPEPAATQHQSRVRNPIDSFVFARLEKQGLSPAEGAPKETLIRRLSLDLIGLPPTVEDIDRFLSDNSPKAYEDLVDRLLDSPHFGEHWAGYWLDLARYADTNGYESDEPRTMWAYRDWVIDAFNRNLPFDEFTIEQLAGDLLPEPTQNQLIATGFHRNTMITNEAGSKEDEFYDAAVKDRIDTTATVWLGSTFGCAQCHDHKYDPFKQTEYYQFYAFFNSTSDSGIKVTDELDVFKGDKAELARRESGVDRLRDILDTDTPALSAAQTDWERKIDGLKSQFADAWQVLHPTAADAASEAEVEIQPDGSVVVSGEIVNADTYELTFTTDLDEITVLRLDPLPLENAKHGGPGRGEEGKAILTNFEAEAWTPALTARHDSRAGGSPEWGPWHYIGPFRVESREQAFREGFPPEQEVDLLATYEDSNLAWLEWPDWKNGRVQQFGEAENCASFIYREVQIEKPTNVRASLGSYNGYKVWLNGELVSSGDPTREIAPDQDWFDLHLLAGKNDLLIKFTNDTGPWGFYFASYVGTEEEARVRFASATAEHNEDELRTAPSVLDGSISEGWMVTKDDFSTGSNPYLMLRPKEPIAAGADTTLKIKLSHHFPKGFGEEEEKGYTLGRFRILASSAGPDAARELVRTPVKVLRALPSTASDRTEEGKALIAAHYRSIAPSLSATRLEYAAKKKDLDEFRAEHSTKTLILRELQEPRETHRQNRGNFLDLAERVYPGVPGILGSIDDPEKANRLTLARWLVSDDNPITARVRVNQIWENLFGRGLVRTAEDLGTQGDSPTHQKLLDWLATEYVRRGWDTKALLKTIVTSSAYRQSSEVTPDKLEKDPDNRLISRGARYRLRGEAIRDYALAVSGLISPKIGGPSVFPPQPESVFADQFIEGGFKAWPTSEGEDRYRRGLYTFYKRTVVYPMYTTFDAPDRTVCTVQRSRSNTPLQALNTLNDPAFVQAAGALAQRMMKASQEDRARLAHGFRRALAREPTPEESQQLLAFRDRMEVKYSGSSALAEEMLASLGLATGSADPQELAPWVLTANVLLNLDEAFTRE